MKEKEESEKVGLKPNIQKAKIMISGPITSWQIDGEIGNSDRLFFFSLSKITADDDCSHEIKICLLLRRKVMNNLDSLLKSRDLFFQKSLSSQGYSFSSNYVWMWELDYKESWMPKNWCFFPVVLEKILGSTLDCKEIQPVYPHPVLGVFWKDWCWSWNSNTLATYCDELTHWKRPWCWEGLKEGEEGGNRGWDGSMPSTNQWTWVWVNSSSWCWTGRPDMLRSMGSQELDMTEWLNWTEY